MSTLEQDQVDALITLQRQKDLAPHAIEVLEKKYLEVMYKTCPYNLTDKDGIIMYMKEIRDQHALLGLEEDMETFEKIYAGMFVRGWVQSPTF